MFSSINLSIFYTNYVRIPGKLEPIQRWTTIHSNIHTHGLCRVDSWPNLPLCCGRKPEQREEIYTATGTTCKLHTERNWHRSQLAGSNPEFSCCEVTMLTAAPPSNILKTISFRSFHNLWILIGQKGTDCRFKLTYSECIKTYFLK